MLPSLGLRGVCLWLFELTVGVYDVCSWMWEVGDNVRSASGLKMFINLTPNKSTLERRNTRHSLSKLTSYHKGISIIVDLNRNNAKPKVVL